MTLSELKSKASFHELLLIDAAIKAHHEMMAESIFTSIVHTAKSIAKDYADIMTAKIIPTIREDAHSAKAIRRAFEDGAREFNDKYGIK